MEQIEQALGKRIIRIETKNLDEMEEVRLPLGLKWMVTHSLRTDHEKGSEMKLLHVASPLNSIFLHTIILVQRFSFTAMHTY